EVVNQRDEVRLSNTTRANEQRMVLCRGEGEVCVSNTTRASDECMMLCRRMSAVADQLDETLRQWLALNKNGFQRFLTHQARSEAGEERCLHKASPRCNRQERCIRGKQKRYVPSGC